jgi:hypothetical protein
MMEARRRGGYNRANARRLRRLLEESALWPVFEAAMDAFVRLEQGELSPQVAVAASHLLKIALETVATAHKLVSKGEGVPPQALPSVTAVTQDEERWARIMARATQLYEEATAPGAPLGLSEKEERQAQLIAEATKILQEHWPRKPEGAGRGFYPPPVPPPPAEMKTTMETPPSRPFAGGRLIVHSHPRWDEEEGASPRGFSA